MKLELNEISSDTTGRKVMPDYSISSTVQDRLANLVISHLKLGDPVIALAIWFKKSDTQKAHLFEAMNSAYHDINTPQLPPAVMTHGQSVIGWSLNLPLEHVMLYSAQKSIQELVRTHDPLIENLKTDYEILYFNSNLLDQSVLDVFGIRLQPDNFIKGIYLDLNESEKITANPGLIKKFLTVKPTIGVMLTSDPLDFERKLGIVHVRSGSQWIPASKFGVDSYVWYKDWLEKHRCTILSEAGTVYEIVGYEFKRDQRISSAVIVPNRNDEYVEISLRKL